MTTAGRGRTAAALVCVAALLTAGCAAPIDGGDRSGGATTPDDGALGDPERDDPEADTLGWERGYWHNESIAVTPDDGLNETERHAVVGRAMARVERLRGMEFEESVPVEIVSREAFASGGSGGGNETSRALDDAKFEALFLVGEGADAVATRERNRRQNVLGYYSPSADRIVVISDTETPTLDGPTLAHELVHALQDQQFDLSNYGARAREPYGASDALVEGDAAYVDHLYERRCGEAWSCATPPDDARTTATTSAPGPDNDSAADSSAGPHVGIAILNYFPYADGSGFVRHFRQRGGWERVNGLYGAPPASAEQIVTPRKYGTDAPTPVAVPDRSGAEWTRLDPAGGAPPSMGMPGITAMFAYPAYDDSRSGSVVPPREFLEFDPDGSVNDTDPINYNISYAEGWDGDALSAYRNGEAEGYVWRSTWDSPEDAREFARGYRDLLAYWGGERVSAAPDGTWRVADGPFADAFRLTVEGSNVTVVNAPSVDALGDVHDPADG